MNKAIIISLMILMPLVACKKEHTVKIIAKNAVTGEPYAGLAYAVKGTRTGNNGEKLVFVHEGFLDANGQATTTFKVNENLALNVGVTTPPNVCYKSSESTNGQSGAWNPKEDPNPTYQFEFAECAKLKLEINNINCQGPTDEIKFRRLWLHQNATNNFVTQTGCFSFTGEFFQLPIGNYKYEWEVTRNGLTTYHDSIFTLTENQMYTFVLEY